VLLLSFGCGSNVTFHKSSSITYGGVQARRGAKKRPARRRIKWQQCGRPRNWRSLLLLSWSDLHAAFSLKHVAVLVVSVWV